MPFSLIAKGLLEVAKKSATTANKSKEVRPPPKYMGKADVVKPKELEAPKKPPVSQVKPVDRKGSGSAKAAGAGLVAGSAVTDTRQDVLIERKLEKHEPVVHRDLTKGKPARSISWEFDTPASKPSIKPITENLIPKPPALDVDKMKKNAMSRADYSREMYLNDNMEISDTKEYKTQVSKDYKKAKAVFRQILKGDADLSRKMYLDID